MHPCMNGHQRTDNPTQVAAIFEFTGAIVLGRVSTATIAGGIAGGLRTYHADSYLLVQDYERTSSRYNICDC